MKTMFLDIETLGSTADNYSVTAIGLAFNSNSPKVLFAETPEEEVKILKELRDIILTEKPSLLVTWHGDDFDLPFLRTRGIIQGLDMSVLDKVRLLDLRHFCKDELMLSQKRLADVAKVLKLQKENTLDGLDMPGFYFQYARGRGGKEEIIRHCEDDVKVTQQLFEKVKRYVTREERE